MSMQIPVGVRLPDACPVAGAVRRTPFYLESRGQSLFAWLHARESESRPDHGVVLCPPVGHEQIHAHRGLRHLADALAQAGFAAVRFDYHGTGDSAGSDEDPARFETWLANVGAAGAWVRQHLGCRRLSLIGLRLGAALATRAAAAQAVDGLLLWAPVVKGRQYVRELKALSLTAGARAEGPGALEAAGFVWTEETLEDLGRLDLLQTRPLCRRALILDRDDMPANGRLLEHYRSLGIRAEQTAQPGYAELMAEPHFTRVPRQAIARAVAWLCAGRPAPRDADGPPDPILTEQDCAPPAAPVRAAAGERVECISRQPNLVGILSEPPDAGAADRLPTVVLLNAGSAYRVGPNRLNVFLSRRLSALGFRCLRLDLCGLGDSVLDDPARENDPYPATAFRDVDLALRHLHRERGVGRVVLMGLCSGAYAAFQSAAQLASPVLVESVAINPLTFFWREGMSLENAPSVQFQSLNDSLLSLGRPAKWLKLLSGRSKLGLGGAARLLGQWWRLRSGQGTPPHEDVVCPPGAVPSHPLRNDLPGDLERIARSGRHLACFFAASDPGHGILNFYARRKVNELRRAGRVSICLIEDSDHTFSRKAARARLAEALTEHLCRRYTASSMG